jgi:hypothetical protein
LKRDFPGWQYDYSLTGWSNGDIALKWLQQIYLPETKPTNPSEWRLLVLDEHSSHVTTRFMYLAWINRVQLLYLPAHTSHKTQPLDRSVFSPNNRMLRSVLYKAGKSLDSKNAEVASLRAQIEELSGQLEAHKPRSKKKVKESANCDGKRTHGWGYRRTSALGLALSAHIFPCYKRAIRIFPLSFPQLSINGIEWYLQRHRASRSISLISHTNDAFARIEEIVAAQKESERPPKLRKTTKTMDPGPVVEQAQDMIVHGLDRLRQAEEM